MEWRQLWGRKNNYLFIFTNPDVKVNSVIDVNNGIAISAENITEHWTQYGTSNPQFELLIRRTPVI